MKRIELVYFDAGGGHRAAANALKHVIEQKRYPWQVNLMNLQELLDSMDIFRKITGIRLQDIYNLLLKKGWTLGSPQLLAAMHVVIRALHPMQVKMLRQYWTSSEPDMVVSLIPNFNRALFRSLHLARPGVPMVTILTDLADYPPHFWIERQRQFFICGSAKAVEQAYALGHDKDRVLRASGMILSPRFYEVPQVDRATELRKLGLDPALPTALMLFGGEGSARMETIVRSLDSSALKLQVIAICGKNQALFERLQSMKTRIPLHSVGFTRDVPYFMRISDFFIGKPGPGSISEAVHMGLPVIVESNAWTLPQERYNADWVREQSVGVVVGDFKMIVKAVEAMLDPDQFARMKMRAATIENRAAFEVPEMLRGILELSPAPEDHV